MAAMRDIAAGVLYDVIEKYDLSHDQVAAMLGIGRKQVRQIFIGERSLPADALLILPRDMADDIVAGLIAARDQVKQRR